MEIHATPAAGLVSTRAATNPSIRFHEAVPPAVLVDYTSSADVGLCLIEDTCLSYRYCMPNKLFEYFAAGVPPIVSNLPELARVVGTDDSGWVAERWSSEAVADIVRRISRRDVADKIEAVARTARRYTWEDQVPKLRELYGRLGFEASAAG